MKKLVLWVVVEVIHFSGARGAFKGVEGVFWFDGRVYDRGCFAV